MLTSPYSRPEFDPYGSNDVPDANSGNWKAPLASQPVMGELQIPGSKSLTNRELILAALAKAGVEDELFKKGAVAGSTVIIGEGNGLVFDWEPTMTSAAELMTGPRGTDERLNQNSRRTNKERRETYYDRMDAKQEARDELVRERDAGLWQVDEEIADER